MEHGAEIDVRGQGHLHEDGVDALLLVQLIDDGEQFGGGDGDGRRVLLAVDAQVVAGFDLVADVDLAGRVLADEHDGQARRPFERCNARLGLTQNFVTNLDAVEDQSLNLWPPLWP